MAARRGARKRKAPTSLVELLRLFIVVFCAGLGFEIAGAVGGDESVLGPFNGVAVGIIVGSGLGYVLGGVVGRTTLTAAEQVEATLRETDAQTIVAAGIGTVVGVLVAAGIAWPLLLIDEPYIRFSLFAFVVVTISYAGLAVGRSKRESILALFGGRAGRAQRHRPVSQLARVVDTSVAVDGRVIEVVRAGFLHGRMLLAQPVITELQGLADSGDDVKRARGRRGLEVLEALKREPGISLEVIDDDPPDLVETDEKLVRIARDHEAALFTLDTNLAKAASLAGIPVLNMHKLTLALRPAVQVGEELTVALLKAGKEQGQAVGYLDDGTMVVIERGRSEIGSEVTARVTSVIMTANGRMVFGQLAGSRS